MCSCGVRGIPIRILARFATIIAFTIAAVVAFAAPASATPCWQAVIDDWYDNARVDKTYQVKCYEDALANLPEDMRAYSSAPDDIERAMRDALRRGQQPATSRGTDSDSEGSSAVGGGSSGDDGGRGDDATRNGGPARLPEGDAPSQTSGGAFDRLLDGIGPDSASAVPLPLIVLTGVAGLLLVFGGGSLVFRRLHSARAGAERR